MASLLTLPDSDLACLCDFPPSFLDLVRQLCSACFDPLRWHLLILILPQAYISFPRKCPGCPVDRLALPSPEIGAYSYGSGGWLGTLYGWPGWIVLGSSGFGFPPGFS